MNGKWSGSRSPQIVLLFVFQPVGDADDADFVGSSFFTTIVTIDVVE